MIEITVKVPDEVANCFGKTPQAAARQVLESAAIEGYRSNRLSRGQVRLLLGFNWQQTEEFLASHGCFRHYTKADLDEDRETLSKLTT